MSTHIVSTGHGYRAAGSDWENVEGPAVVFDGSDASLDLTPRLMRESGGDWADVPTEVAAQWDRLRRHNRDVLDSLRRDPHRELSDTEWKSVSGVGVSVIAAGFVVSGGPSEWRAAGPCVDFLDLLHDAEG